MRDTNIGMRIKQTREEKQLTLKQLSDYSGLSIGFISQIERNQADPSLASLKKLTFALGLKMKDLFESEDHVHVIVKKGEGAMLDVDSSTRCELLAPAIDKTMEPMIKDIAPGGESGLVDGHAGEEFIWVIEGTLQVSLGETRHLLSEGDSVYFKANQTHAWKNVGTVLCRAMWVMTPPSYS